MKLIVVRVLVGVGNLNFKFGRRKWFGRTRGSLVGKRLRLCLVEP